MLRINSKAGFTIIELMIAISVLSVVLLISSEVIVGVGDLFYKGVNTTNVQDTARNVLQDLVSSVEFSTSEPQYNNSYTFNSGKANQITVDAICFGAARYSYVVNSVSNMWTHSIWVDQMASAGNCVPLDLALDPPTCATPASSKCEPTASNSTGSELAGANIHVGDISLIPATGTQGTGILYQITVNLASGVQGVFKMSGSLPKTQNGNFVCAPGSSQQYCAISSLNTYASSRM